MSESPSLPESRPGLSVLGVARAWFRCALLSDPARNGCIGAPAAGLRLTVQDLQLGPHGIFEKVVARHRAGG